MLVEAGDLWAKRARNMPMAALAYEEALAIKPRDHGLLHTLLWLYGELGWWEKLVETLRAVVELHADPVAKAKSVYAMAMVVRDHLGELRRAAALLEEVLDLDPKRLDAFERIVRVHTELRDWMELKHAYGRMLRRLKSGSDIELRHALFFQLGLIYRDRLGDAARALDAFRAAQRLKPDATDVRKGIVELFVVTDQLDEGVDMVRAALKKRPLEAGLYVELYELFLRKRAFDRAWCAVDALVALGDAARRGEDRFYTDYPPPVLSQVPGTLVGERVEVAHPPRGARPGAHDDLRARHARGAARARRARPVPAASSFARGAAPDERRRRPRSAAVRRRCLRDLTFPAPTLHARKGQTIPLSLAPAKNAMFVSLEACEALPTDALAFVVGKRLAEMRPELTARAACPSVSELRGLLRWPRSSPTAVAVRRTPGTRRSTGRSRSRSRARSRRAAGGHLVGEGARARSSTCPVVEPRRRSAARVGLLLSGRLDAARRGMTSDPRSGDLLAARQAEPAPRLLGERRVRRSAPRDRDER